MLIWSSSPSCLSGSMMAVPVMSPHTYRAVESFMRHVRIDESVAVNRAACIMRPPVCSSKTNS